MARFAVDQAEPLRDLPGGVARSPSPNDCDIIRLREGGVAGHEEI